MRLLESLSDLEAVLAEKDKTIVLFKHSTSCPISARALEEYESLVQDAPGAALYTYLDLIAHRDVSDAIAEQVKVRHESPQAIVIGGGKVEAVFSHFDIRKEALQKAISSSRPGAA